MGTTDDNKKKPLVLLDAANPVEPTPTVQDLAKSDNQVGAGWGKDNDELSTLTQQQLENIQNAPDGVSVNDINKVPGKTEPKLNKSTTNYGVLAGAPSQVVIQHMLDQLPPMETKEQREKRERRERINRTMAALGDGFSSLANIYYTTKGAPAAEGKTLSAGENERQEKARKERESAVDRRIRLLKEQLADRNRIEELKIKEQLAENLKEHRGNQIQLGKDRNEETYRHNTVMEVQNKEDKDREAKRKENNDKADNARKDKVADSQVNKNNAQGAAATKNARTNAAKVGETRRHNQETERQGRERNQETQRHHRETEENQRNKKTNPKGGKTGGKNYTNTKSLGL